MPSKPAEKENLGTEPVCLSCGAGSQRRVLLPCLVKGEDKWVCVRCLPVLIHGGE